MNSAEQIKMLHQLGDCHFKVADFANDQKWLEHMHSKGFIEYKRGPISSLGCFITKDFSIGGSVGGVTGFNASDIVISVEILRKTFNTYKSTDTMYRNTIENKGLL